jgi:hypothetical protein
MKRGQLVLEPVWWVPATHGAKARVARGSTGSRLCGPHTPAAPDWTAACQPAGYRVYGTKRSGREAYSCASRELAPSPQSACASVAPNSRIVQKPNRNEPAPDWGVTTVSLCTTKSVFSGSRCRRRQKRGGRSARLTEMKRVVPSHAARDECCRTTDTSMSRRFT